MLQLSHSRCSNVLKEDVEENDVGEEKEVAYNIHMESSISSYNLIIE
jgi:hypothetical protein